MASAEPSQAASVDGRVRIGQRDLELLDFIARFGFVSRMSLMKRWGEERARVSERLALLARERLIAVSEGGWDGDTLHSLTSAGARACGRGELVRPPDRCAERFAIVAEMAACEERLGKRVLSAREIEGMSRVDRYASESLCVVHNNGRIEPPDMVRINPSGPPEGIVVLLEPMRLDPLIELLRSWGWAITEKRFAGVSLLCAAEMIDVAREAVSWDGAEATVKVQGLWSR